MAAWRRRRSSAVCRHVATVVARDGGSASDECRQGLLAYLEASVQRGQWREAEIVAYHVMMARHVSADTFDDAAGN